MNRHNRRGLKNAINISSFGAYIIVIDIDHHLLDEGSREETETTLYYCKTLKIKMQPVERIQMSFDIIASNIKKYFLNAKKKLNILIDIFYSYIIFTVLLAEWL